MGYNLCLVKRGRQVAFKGLFLLCILLIAGCSGKKALIQSAVTGEWYSSDLEGCLRFDAGGTVSLSRANGAVIEGTYRVASGSRLKITWIGVLQGEPAVETVRVESFTENTLILAKDKVTLWLCRNGSAADCSCDAP
jgi:hypothetical protein